MRVLIILFVLIFSISPSSLNAQKKEKFKLTSSSIIKDENGKIVSIGEVVSLLNSKKWMVDPVKNEEGKITYYQLRKATSEEAEKMNIKTDSKTELKKADPVGLSNNKTEGKKKETLKITPATVIKDVSGEIISIVKLQELIREKKWSLDPIRDEDGNLEYVQVRKATEAEMAKIKSKPTYGNPSELVGKKAPDFNFTDSNGKAITSENTKGKVVVLNFWFTACPPCIDELPELNKVYDSFSNNEQIVFAAITFDEDDKIETFLEKYDLKYPIVSNASKTCSDFGVTGYPTNIVIGKDGKFKEVIVGGFGGVGERVSEAIRGVLK